MGYLSRVSSQIGGRRLIVGLGGWYVASAAGFPVLERLEYADTNTLIASILVGGSGLALFYGGYRLPGTDIRPDLYHVVAGWCVRAVEVVLVILLFIALISDLNDPLGNLLILTSLASVAGLGMGYHDGRAKTRAVDAEEYSQELERYKTIVETASDGIYISDDNDQFTLVNDAYCELVGYDREDLLGSSSLVLADEVNVESLYGEVQRDVEEGATDSNTYETKLETASGEIIDVEWSFSPLSETEDGIPETVGVVRDVTVTVGDLPDGFYVADDGEGIPADDREAIFETGYTTASDNGGMGLGLAFVQMMADVYGWECRVTESEAGGAQFEFAGVTRAKNAAD